MVFSFQVYRGFKTLFLHGKHKHMSLLAAVIVCLAKLLLEAKLSFLVFTTPVNKTIVCH
jgi:hypothetical protein